MGVSSAGPTPPEDAAGERSAGAESVQRAGGAQAAGGRPSRPAPAQHPVSPPSTHTSVQTVWQGKIKIIVWGELCRSQLVANRFDFWLT